MKLLKLFSSSNLEGKICMSSNNINNFQNTSLKGYPKKDSMEQICMSSNNINNFQNTSLRGGYPKIAVCFKLDVELKALFILISDYALLKSHFSITVTALQRSLLTLNLSIYL